MTEELNFIAICNLTTRVMGLPNGSLVFKTRTRNIQTARSVASYIGLTEENIPRNVIAKVLKRDRSVSYHYQRTHKKNFKQCNVYRNTFIKVLKKYKNVIFSKDVFITGKQMKNHLLLNKVYESKESDIKLKIISGNSQCIIYTTYLDYINQIKNIKLAMKDYHYTIKII